LNQANLTKTFYSLLEISSQQAIYVKFLCVSGLKAVRIDQNIALFKQSSSCHASRLSVQKSNWNSL